MRPLVWLVLIWLAPTRSLNFGRSSFVSHGGEDLCVSYVHFEHPTREDRREECKSNLGFFLQHGYSDRGFYYFTLNGFECTVPLPDAANVLVTSRANIGLDIAAHGIAQKYFLQHRPKCEYFFFF
mmetsp:Transcript_65744/g.155298  ORF Transcript_65744/g.155298 Transcript_65744/m.155298 type:complete len:125 (-) Transcript_65744:410-784(-)